MRQNINLNSLSEFLSVVITPRELADCLADVAMNYITTRDEEEDNMKQIKNDVAILQMLIQQLRETIEEVKGSLLGRRGG